MKPPFMLSLCLAVMPVCGVVRPVPTRAGDERNVSTRALDELSWRQLNTIHEKVAGEEYEEARV